VKLCMTKIMDFGGNTTYGMAILESLSYSI
jgi:hypothetical protein